MLIQKINRIDAEHAYLNVKNISGDTMTLGYPCCYDFLATNSLGSAVSKPATSTLPMFAGVAKEDIANDGVGLIQAYGYNASTVVHVGANSVSAAGLGVGPVNAGWSLQTTGYPADAMKAINSAAPLVAIMENDISGSGYVKTFIRSL